MIRFASAPSYVLGVFTLGALFLILYRGRFWFSGIAIAGLAFVLWSEAERPDILITENGRLVGVSIEHGWALSRSEGNGFAAQVWLENYGDGTVQSVETERQRFGNNNLVQSVAGEQVAYLWGKKLSSDQTSAACRSAKILIAPQYKDEVIGACQAPTLKELRKGGAVAVLKTQHGLRVQTARDKSGTRLWNR